MHFLRSLGLVGIGAFGTFGIARQAWAQPENRLDPEICAQWKSKLEGEIGNFSDFQSLAREIGAAEPIENGFEKPIPLENLTSGGASDCLSLLIQENPDLHDSAEFLPLRLRLLNANGDGLLDKAEVGAKISGAKTAVDRKKNAEAAAYGVVVDKISRSPEDASPVTAPSLTSVKPESPTGAHLDKTLRNAQEKNRLFLIGGMAISAVVIALLLVAKKVFGSALWRFGLVKLFPSQHERLLQGPRRKAEKTITKIDAVSAAAERRLRTKKNKKPAPAEVKTTEKV
jgi:hypothetical protein